MPASKKRIVQRPAQPVGQAKNCWREDLSFLEAAVTVLESAERSLTLAELTAEALRRGLISSAGKTPIAAMSARLYIDLRDNPKTRLIRHAQPGPNRARRGSVRWSLRPQNQ